MCDERDEESSENVYKNFVMVIMVEGIDCVVPEWIRFGILR